VPAEEALQRIAALYAAEDTIRGKPPDIGRATRQARSRPLVADLFAWLEQQLARLPGRSPTTEAIRYALNHRDGLEQFLGLRCKVCGKSRTAATGPRSGGALEQLGDKGGLGPYVSSANLRHLPLPGHCHRFVACQCSSCRVGTAEAKPRSDQAFHASVILFHYVIEKLAL
jgi:hypothetical protein